MFKKLTKKSMCGPVCKVSNLYNLQVKEAGLVIVSWKYIHMASRRKYANMLDECSVSSGVKIGKERRAILIAWGCIKLVTD